MSRHIRALRSIQWQVHRAPAWPPHPDVIDILPECLTGVGNRTKPSQAEVLGKTGLLVSWAASEGPKDSDKLIARDTPGSLFSASLLLGNRGDC